MDIKKKTLIVGVGVAAFIVVFSLFAFSDIFRGYDAVGYVQAVLEQKFKGNVEPLVELTEGVTEEELYEQYETEILSYVESNLLSGIAVDEECKGKYVELTKKIFSSMKYEVGESEKISSKEYKVTVTYRATDVISKFTVLLAEEQQRLQEKADNSEYQEGNDAEILLQMQKEFLNNSCTLFEQAYETMEFGEEQAVIFTIQKDKDGLYNMSNEEIMEFVEKITGIDE